MVSMYPNCGNTRIFVSSLLEVLLTKNELLPLASGTSVQSGIEKCILSAQTVALRKHQLRFDAPSPSNVVYNRGRLQDNTDSHDHRQ